MRDEPRRGGAARGRARPEEIPSCQPPSAPGAGLASPGSGATPTFPRTGEAGSCRSGHAYGQLRMNAARPSWNARRASSSAAVTTDGGESPSATSRAQPPERRARLGRCRARSRSPSTAPPP